MKTVEETKKTKEDQVELKNDVRENAANTPEGVMPDDAVEAVAGGTPPLYAETPDFHKGVRTDNTGKNRLR